MSEAHRACHHAAMTTYLIEIHMADLGTREFERAVQMLGAAQARMHGATARTTFAGRSRADGTLVCLIEAVSLQSVRRMLVLAMLPAGRIREIADVAPPGSLGGRHPRGDVHPGAEAELVEDVVDVGLDGSLGQE
jgi:hypothetical protein